ncbi:MAG: DUF4864 domain-containing protein [Aestuariivirgaceae bacterium]
MPHRQILLALAIVLGLDGPAAAQTVSDSDQAAFRSIISSQIEAMRSGDAAKAFSYASPTLNRQFGTAETFMEMVRRGYQPVVDPRSFTFGPVTTEMSSRPTQVVTIVDKAGKSWTALYAFERQPDGTWRISGVILKELEGLDAQATRPVPPA